jgi:hypothetical protein
VANTVDKVFTNTYESNVRHLAQQSNVRLRPHITETHAGGVNHSWETLASSAAVTKSTRLTATPATDPVWAKRVSVPTTKHWADSAEAADLNKMLIDPKSSLAENGSRAMGRAIDDLIIAAATGTALDGDGAANAFPAGQLIGDGTGVISFDMVTAVTELFLQNDIDPDEPKVFVIGPTQMRKLLQLTEATSSDYTNMKILADKGFLESWMGYGWVVTNRLTIPAGGQLSCLAFTKKALGMNVNNDIFVKVAEDPSRSFAWIVYLEATMGVVRTEDKHIVHVKVKNSMT